MPRSCITHNCIYNSYGVHDYFKYSTFEYTHSHFQVYKSALKKKFNKKNSLTSFFSSLSSTHDKVQQNADIIWKNQRYQLILECNSYPILPIPFNLLYYLYYLLFKIPLKCLVYICSKKCETTNEDNDFYNLSQQNQNTTAESNFFKYL